MICILVCMDVHVLMSTYVCMCICICMCRPKADIRYLPWSLSTLYVEARSFESQPLQPVWLGSLLERIPVPTSHTLASQASHQIHEAFVWVLGIQTLACVTQQASPSGTCSPLFLRMGCASWRYRPQHFEIPHPQRHSKPTGSPSYCPQETAGGLRMNSKVQASLPCLFSQDFVLAGIPFEKSAECALLFKTRVDSLEFATCYFRVYSRSNFGSA